MLQLQSDSDSSSCPSLIDKCHMTANLLVYVGLNSNPLGKTLRSDASESKRFFHCIREPSRTKFKLSHALEENNLTTHYVITVWRKKEKTKMLTNKSQTFEAKNTKAIIRNNKT